MDIEKIYESVILRDILEYLTPGAISLAGFCLLVDSISSGLGLGFSLFNKIYQGGMTSAVLIAPLAYIIGHHLTEVRYVMFGDKEAGKAIDVLSKNDLLKNQATQVVMEHLQLSKDDAEEMLGNSKSAEAVREIGRSIIYHRLPSLHREFVGRHSILSRLSRNVSLALTEFLLFALLSSVFVWGKISSVYHHSPKLMILAVASIGLLLLALIVLYSNRASKLRGTMTKHTFQIWYSEPILQKLIKPSDKPSSN